jgi:hypothetical protein
MPSLNIYPIKVKRESADEFKLLAKSLNVTQIDFFDILLQQYKASQLPEQPVELNPTEFAKSHFNNAIWETYFKTEPDALTDYIVSYDNKPPKTANYRSEQYATILERVISYYTARNKSVYPEILLPR